MNGPCRDCPNHKEPPLSPPVEAEEGALTDEEIQVMKEDQTSDERRGK